MDEAEKELKKMLEGIGGQQYVFSKNVLGGYGFIVFRDGKIKVGGYVPGFGCVEDDLGEGEAEWYLWKLKKLKQKLKQGVKK